jgi:nuclear transport factor 2 (NTF2) superfamily protein
MSVAWLDTERRLAEALAYIGAEVTDDRGELWLTYTDENWAEHPALNISELARALDLGR